MKRAEFTEEIARALDIPDKEAKLLLESILDSMVKALQRGERIEIRGFGSFSTHIRGPRKRRNPRSGIELDVPAKRVPNFKAGAELIALVNRGR